MMMIDFVLYTNYSESLFTYLHIYSNGGKNLFPMLTLRVEGVKKQMDEIW